VSSSHPADLPRPSRTSQAVAVTRAEFRRPTTPTGDPDAQAHLCEGMHWPVPPDRVPSLRARTRFFDDAVLTATTEGTRQIVILGAGYDDRALRFRTPGIRFIEVDHPATQDDKARRVRELLVERSDEEPTFVAADFALDDVGVALEAAGHDAARPSLFIGEGLLAYLDEPTIVRLLRAVRNRAPEGSVLAVSLAVHAAGIDSERLKQVANTQRRAGAAEPWLTILPTDAHLELLTRAGWRIERTVDQVELDAEAPAGKSLLVTARAEDADL
jgi:methyltransferase (TIGR00027 family)